MDESSVQINCRVCRYGSARKGYRALHFSTHLTRANYTLHGKMYHEVTSGASNSFTFIQFMYNATNAILDDGWSFMSPGMHVILDNASIHKTYSENVVHQHLNQLGIGYHFCQDIVVI